MLIAEIILTVIAWKRGWRGWALLPVLIAFSLGFSGVGSGSLAYALIVDGTAIVGLIIMVVNPRRVTPSNNSDITC